MIFQIQKLSNKFVTKWIDFTNVVWKHGSPKYANCPNNTRSIFPLIFKISKKYCKMTVSNCNKHNWLLEVTNINRNPILRTYTMFKTEFGSEKYIEDISDCRYRIAMTKLRSSSHTLEVERGRYTKPKTNICERLCPVCNVIEDEIYFLANCKLYDAERTHFLGNVTAKVQNLHELNDADKFILLMSSKDKQILVWTGKSIYKCFNIRSRCYLNYCGV